MKIQTFKVFLLPAFPDGNSDEIVMSEIRKIDPDVVACHVYDKGQKNFFVTTAATQQEIELCTYVVYATPVKER